jgi:hypothetical protein
MLKEKNPMQRTTMTILIMMLSILTWFSPPLVHAAGSALAADKAGQEGISTDQKPQPEVTIPDPLFTFPNVVDGTEVVHDFPVYNRGAGDLTIAKVQTG